MEQTMKPEWKTCFRICISLFILFLAIRYWDTIAGLGSALISAASALILGCVIAYLLNILMSFYERHYFRHSKSGFIIRSRRAVCLLAAIATLAGIVVLILRIVVPELANCIALLFAEIPAAIDRVVSWARGSDYFASLVPEDVFSSLSNINWQEKAEQMVRFLLEGIGGAAQIAVSAVSSAVSLVIKFVIGTIFAVYILTGKEKLASQFDRLMRRYLRPSWDEKLRYVLTTLNTCFRRFIVGQCTEAVILGLLCMLGMMVCGFPYAAMIGTLIGFTALIPVAGAYIGAGVGAFMILTVSPLKALWFLVFILVLQQLEGNLIYPKVVGTSIGLPGVWVLTAVTIGGGLFGVTGMLLFVPLAAAAYQMLKTDVNRKLTGSPVSAPAKDSPAPPAGK